MMMEGRELSPRERQILAEIERTLEADALLARRLRTMRRGVRPWAGPAAALRGHLLAVLAWLAGLTSLVLFVPAAATSSPPLIWGFAGAWVLTLVCVLRLGWRACRRRAALRGPDGPDARDGPDGPLLQ
ncbi:DUF3040 domain-containing protein [Streptomyces antimicrobicus]|uniref:DUF3040 domain-containing protein n=1 Tax=Streptomyces antimicrobicus TaxID=2883108 RepID=A0ABS8B5D1_9ACTN|nr:DUF3040 domain-containing protein [Streptomyces antimicrobicus]MCB5179796.1 DUF3040 domain-containing protein [Streptomyces antimicrobicus]